MLFFYFLMMVGCVQLYKYMCFDDYLTTITTPPPKPSNPPHPNLSSPQPLTPQPHNLPTPQPPNLPTSQPPNLPTPNQALRPQFPICVYLASVHLYITYYYVSLNSPMLVYEDLEKAVIL